MAAKGQSADVLDTTVAFLAKRDGIDKVLISSGCWSCLIARRQRRWGSVTGALGRLYKHRGLANRFRIAARAQRSRLMAARHAATQLPPAAAAPAAASDWRNPWPAPTCNVVLVLPVYLADAQNHTVHHPPAAGHLVCRQPDGPGAAAEALRGLGRHQPVCASFMGPPR